MKLRKGYRRWTLLIGNYAFKFPALSSLDAFTEGLLHNISEYGFSLIEEPLLCPVIWHMPGGLLNVMPRCECGVWPGWEEKDCALLDEWQAMAEASPRKNLLSHIVDMKEDSVGLLPNGAVVAVDYAQPFIKLEVEE